MNPKDLMRKLDRESLEEKITTKDVTERVVRREINHDFTDYCETYGWDRIVSGYMEQMYYKMQK